MAQLSRGNPKFSFLSGGRQDQHINESSAVHFSDQGTQPNSLLTTLGHLPVLFVSNAKEKLLCLQLWRSPTPAEKGRGVWRRLFVIYFLEGCLFRCEGQFDFLSLILWGYL